MKFNPFSQVLPSSLRPPEIVLFHAKEAQSHGARAAGTGAFVWHMVWGGIWLTFIHCFESTDCRSSSLRRSHMLLLVSGWASSCNTEVLKGWISTIITRREQTLRSCRPVPVNLLRDRLLAVVNAHGVSRLSCACSAGQWLSDCGLAKPESGWQWSRQSPL